MKARRCLLALLVLPALVPTTTVQAGNGLSPDIIDRRNSSFMNPVDLAEGVLSGLQWEYQLGVASRNPVPPGFYVPGKDASSK